tara:strand:- start:25667 stop:26401 length:735 start_codon:yes stop_codon:yes gene_type:complete
MQLQVIGSGSQGNSYLLSNDTDVLLIELGVQFKRIKKALDYDLSKINGALVSHSHGDHAKAIKDAIECGINVYSGADTFKATGLTSHRFKIVEPKKPYQVGSFKIMPFELRHDVPCLGFLIKHPECGKVVFITDTFYSPWRFAGVNNWIIEANYSQEIIDGKQTYDDVNMMLRNRVMSSHLSIENCLDLLRKNNLTQTNNIVLTHLSDRNSDEKKFKRLTENQTGKTVHVARTGLKIDFNLRPF